MNAGEVIGIHQVMLITKGGTRHRYPTIIPAIQS